MIRARLHLHAEGVMPGELNDILRVALEDQLATVTGWIEKFADDGEITLRMDARRTAVAICAQIDGMLWLALASDRPLDEAIAEISQGLDCFVLARPTPDAQ